MCRPLSQNPFFKSIIFILLVLSVLTVLGFATDPQIRQSSPPSQGTVVLTPYSFDPGPPPVTPAPIIGNTGSVLQNNNSVSILLVSIILLIVLCIGGTISLLSKHKVFG
jgi:hypothetical protein